MKTVLFAWELGGGSGHIANIARYAARLSGHGVRSVAAVKVPAAAGPLATSGIDVMPAPAWAEASFTPEQRATLSAVSMGDALATLGLGYPDALDALLAGWERILAEVRPDLVVADYAPAASLLARKRIPLLLAGNGFTLPPSEMTHFPLLHRHSPPLWDELRLLSILNKAGRAHRAEPLARLPELFSGDAYQVETLPLLDPYDLQRLMPVDGPVFDKAARGRTPEADEILVYLARGIFIHPGIVDALLPFSNRIRIYAPGLSAGQLADFAAQGARVHSEPLDLPVALENARLAVHLGGSGLAAHAVAAGVPQLVFSIHIEQEFNGAALERHGIGRLVRSHDPAMAIDTGVVSAMLADSRLAQQANRAGDVHRTLLRDCDPQSAFEQKARALLGI